MIWERKLGTVLETSSVFGGREELVVFLQLWKLTAQPGRRSLGPATAGGGQQRGSRTWGCGLSCPASVTLRGVGHVLCPSFPSCRLYFMASPACRGSTLLILVWLMLPRPARKACTCSPHGALGPGGPSPAQMADLGLAYLHFQSCCQHACWRSKHFHSGCFFLCPDCPPGLTH